MCDVLWLYNEMDVWTKIQGKLRVRVESDSHIISRRAELKILTFFAVYSIQRVKIALVAR